MGIFQLRAHALGVGLAAGAVLIGPANASLSISKAPTQNVACENARCVATAAEAVLNVEDLHYLLADDPSVSVQAGTARNMTIDAPLTWTRSNTLGLSARGQITVNKPVTAT